MKEPLIVMLGLILLMFVAAFCVRMYSVIIGKVTLNHYKTFSEKTEPEYVTKTINNLNNQFQLPLLFVCACVLAIALKIETPGVIFNAWAFVICRVAHSIVHITVNIVLLRSVVFAVGFYFLASIWHQIYLQS
ncbi:MAG: MAPEG family protein [Pseudomonadota bacterium]